VPHREHGVQLVRMNFELPGGSVFPPPSDLSGPFDRHSSLPDRRPGLIWILLLSSVPNPLLNYYLSEDEDDPPSTFQVSGPTRRVPIQILRYVPLFLFSGFSSL